MTAGHARTLPETPGVDAGHANAADDDRPDPQPKAPLKEKRQVHTALSTS